MDDPHHERSIQSYLRDTPKCSPLTAVLKMSKDLVARRQTAAILARAIVSPRANRHPTWRSTGSRREPHPPRWCPCVRAPREQDRRPALCWHGPSAMGKGRPPHGVEAAEAKLARLERELREPKATNGRWGWEEGPKRAPPSRKPQA